MCKNLMNYWFNSSFLSSGNQIYVEKLYERYLNNPELVDHDWKYLFDNIIDINFNNKLIDISIKNNSNKFLTNLTNKQEDISNNLSFDNKAIKVFEFLNAFRCFGHLHANLDPLQLLKRKNISELNPKFYGLMDSDFEKIVIFHSFLINNKKSMKLGELYNFLKKIYCSSIGIEYMHLTDLNEKYWIQNKLENSININLLYDFKDKVNFLNELIFAENLEKYLGSKFPGSKRFSLEGCDVLILVLKDLIRYSSKFNIHEVMLSMAHRGRLNVLVNVFGKSPDILFNEFLGKNISFLGSGDVKYHQGLFSNFKTINRIIYLTLLFNPSHLEIVNSVLAGSVRAKLDRFSNNTLDEHGILPITIHGDASITGQGVIQEILNMSHTRGYKIGGTIRIVINNQIGFTTSNVNDSRSTEYCTNIMKMLDIPIFHVNADDIESVIFVSRLAFDFKNKFKRDVVIDLVSYRRHGHNEADEPSVTQPLMYKKIKAHPTSSVIYSNKLLEEKIIDELDIIKTIKSFNNKLDLGVCVVNEHVSNFKKKSLWTSYLVDKLNCIYSVKKVNKLQLINLAKRVFTIPLTIIMQSRVKKIYEERLKMVFERNILDWGAVEILTYATLLADGIDIRISGEDVSRGTFFHRHAVIHNQNDGSTYIPLNNIGKKQGKFNIWDSVLSEESVLAFEYGYSITEPRVLNIWEAQFGDFANGAQIVIDQFISSGEQKWGMMCGLVMLLPHGYEGQGPEHSSARLERYLQLCSEDNMIVCVPSIPSQIYHIFRYQILSNIRKPLIIMSPKSLLRHPLAMSTIDDLACGEFQLIIDEIDDDINKKIVSSVIFCSGKVYYDLLEERRKSNIKNIAIIRIEQLYPFPMNELKKIMKYYNHISDFIWCQEEPMNQGAWFFVEKYIKYILPKDSSLLYVGRLSSASPAVGYLSIHHKQQKKIINSALKK